MKVAGDQMRSWFSLYNAFLILMLFFPGPSDGQSFRSLPHDQGAAVQAGDASFRTVAGKDETRTEPSTKTAPETEYRPAREIKQFTAPTILLRGTAVELGLDDRTLTSFLEMQFLGDFAFLQNDFAFDKTYETWEIGLFACEAWTVGGHYPIAFHIECSAGSMDEPRNWHYATLGYGPKDKIVELVRKTLDTIVTEYAAFVRKARGMNEGVRAG
jgi:hypothetical protein